MGLIHIALFVTLDLVGRTPGGPRRRRSGLPVRRPAGTSRGRPDLSWSGSTQLCPDLAGEVREIRDRYEHIKGLGSLSLVHPSCARNSSTVSTSGWHPGVLRCWEENARSLKACTACMQRMPCIGIHPLQVTHASRAACRRCAACEGMHSRASKLSR